MGRVHVTHGRNITKNDLVGTDANNGTIRFEEFLNRLALSKTKYVCGQPKVGDGIVPWTGYRAQRRQEKIVDSLDNQACECDRAANDGEIMAKPGRGEVDREEDSWVHNHEGGACLRRCRRKGGQ